MCSTSFASGPKEKLRPAPVLDGIRSERISETPVAIIDFETTGLSAGTDRVIEVSIVRIDPSKTPSLVLDTLVNPERPVTATEIHGITDSDVADAPRFEDVVGEIVAATSGCVIAAYNAYFDMKFLEFELNRVGVTHQPPYFCLMYLRTMLGLGPRCKLNEACQSFDIEIESAHRASDDALAAAELFQHFQKEINKQNIETFADLAAKRKYKFNSSFKNYPLPSAESLGLARTTCLLPRPKDSQRLIQLEKHFRHIGTH